MPEEYCGEEEKEGEGGQWGGRGGAARLAVTEKMRIWRQGDKEFKQNEACRLAALPSVTGVISWGSLSLCLLPLFIWEWERGGEAAALAPRELRPAAAATALPASNQD